MTWFTRCGLALTAAQINGNMMTVFNQYKEESKSLLAASKAIPPTKPDALDDLKNWRPFWEQLQTYFGRLRGAANCPLSYVFRAQAVVTNEDRNLYRSTRDSWTYYNISLAGTHFMVDNKQVYEEFQTIIGTGPGQTFIRTYNRTKDGRGAILALKQQCEGSNISRIIVNKAYSELEKKNWEGAKRNYSFTNYVQKHIECHNELEEQGETVTEQRKVHLFLCGITDPALLTAKEVVEATPSYRENFDGCQRYFTELLAQRAASGTMHANKRSVQAIETPNKQNASKNVKKNNGNNNNHVGKGNKNKDDGRTKPNAQDLDPTHDGYRPRHIWKQLPADVKEAILKSKNAKKESKNRSTSTLRTEAADTNTNDDSSTEGNSPERQVGKAAYECTNKKRSGRSNN